MLGKHLEELKNEKIKEAGFISHVYSVPTARACRHAHRDAYPCGFAE